MTIVLEDCNLIGERKWGPCGLYSLPCQRSCKNRRVCNIRCCLEDCNDRMVNTVPVHRAERRLVCNSRSHISHNWFPLYDPVIDFFMWLSKVIKLPKQLNEFLEFKAQWAPKKKKDSWKSNSRIVRIWKSCPNTDRAVDADTATAIFATYIEGQSSFCDIVVVPAGIGVAVTVAFFAMKTYAGSARLPRDLVVHGAAFVAAFSASVTFALALLMLKINEIPGSRCEAAKEKKKKTFDRTRRGDDESLENCLVSGSRVRFVTPDAARNKFSLHKSSIKIKNKNALSDTLLETRRHPEY